MKLRTLLAAVPEMVLPEHPALEQEVKGLATNSLACQPGDLFIGMPGTRVDGGDFWAGAIAAGAIAAVVSLPAAEKATANGQPGKSSSQPCILPAPDMVRACAQLAGAFYGYPARQMKLVGVTGTNGKTTTTHLIEFLLNQAQKPTALMGTLYARWGSYQQTAAHTTPFAVELQRQLAEAQAAGSEYGVMEVSSHALAQGRVMGCPFEVAVFTNLTQDHLDFHRDMDDYFAAKALLFSPDYLQGRAIVNWDDPYGQRLIQPLERSRLWSYSTHESSADLWTSDLVYGPDGVRGILHTPQGEAAFQSPLVGQFNLSNLLAAVGAALHLGLELEAIVKVLPQFSGVPGRMEQVQIAPDQDISVIVDYAHTPDSLENLLRAARPFIPGKMICVFGCGGDRDRGKRPQMGRIAADLADVVYVTSDNPRTEDPHRILQDILAGIPDSIAPVVIADRAVAIRTAILQAQPGDGVLIAGKGHEDYQILGTEKIHFDDREQAREALKERNH
ncbi:UDP-N-acetylmuramoyl-L-alanyl-D-glutamate--2,6-diaminopimelate ligase [Leptothermofonsia sichuanensis E412]|uniref:UDP-N-acetylmuramoyl-L-alanyl-D-glutamate--2, 6-diaminopimelate ligase n=1 Tax=Leptothermofonsia sichuanensis TaxID=2917832 RepID=UPI001CA69962|nr:UDP-N-acetylmuramoyl-L-alanyl-D-glutamate--2,6-diaminopimelate ligase [Leptothermofonsia sichuanensis]QZZ22849.1 UDP-N-acetylmuramoyl-L-alanyl-D-glutamate--2,6-diaminopimelate ligase [Leptothermofonsia sichuanensis E412]